MHKGRLEAFSDAVIAIIMTVMVLELKAPKGPTLEALEATVPTLSLYLLSFVFLAIYWNNHHHMLQVAKHVNGAVLWANMHLLFWLSLIPFGTDWMGATHLAHWPVALYGVLLLMCGVAYSILQLTLIAANGKNSEFAKALGSDFKGKASVGLYAVAIALTWVNPVFSCVAFATVACMWLIPDKRMERALGVHENNHRQ
jgi:uncharacterized membrane protein